MNRKKWVILALVIGGVGLVAYLVISGMVKPAKQVEKAAVPQPSATSSAPPQQGLVAGSTGIDSVGPTYRPSASDMMGWIEPLVSFDSKDQTYDQWHKYADDNIVYTPQDFPKESVLGITPSAGEWREGWKRDFKAGSAEELPAFDGQGGAKVYTWVIGGPQMLYGPDGQPWIGGYNDVTVAAQCAGDTPDSCRILAYSGTYPLDFKAEKALYTP